MHFLIVILNKLVRIISRQNRLVSKIALGDHLVGWSSIRGSIFRRIGYVLRGTFVFLTRARARGVRGYFWDSGSFRRRPGCGRRFCDFRKTFIFCANLLPDAFFDRFLMQCSIFCEKRDLGRLRSCSCSRKRRIASLLKGKCTYAAIRFLVAALRREATSLVVASFYLENTVKNRKNREGQ